MVPRKGRTVRTDDTHADEVTSAEEVRQASEAAAGERISRLLDPAAIDGLLADADAAGLSIDGPDGLIDRKAPGQPSRLNETHRTALAGVIERHGLPREPLEAMIDARCRELDATPLEGAEALEWARGTAGQAAEVAARILDEGGVAGRALAAGAIWALSKRDLPIDPAEAELAKADARLLRPAAFPAAAHAVLALKPAGSEFGKRMRLTWAVARGRL